MKPSFRSEAKYPHIHSLGPTQTLTLLSEPSSQKQRHQLLVENPKPKKSTPTGFAPAIPTPSAVADGLASTSLSASSVEVVARGIEPTHTESCDSTLPSGTSTTKGAGRGERGYFRRQIYNPDFHNPADEIIPNFVNFWKNLRKFTQICEF